MDDAARAMASGYAGMEDPASFPDRAAMEAYRASVLARSGAQADRLEPLLPPSAWVLEVACGNGRLLIELAARGAIGRGLGCDIAESRVAFAKSWAEDLGLGQLTFETADVLAGELEQEAFDAVACITGAFGYFEPIAPGSAAALAQKMLGALKPGGLLCLELYPAPRYRRAAEAAGGEARIWDELPAEDPWRFYLHHVLLEGKVLTHNKTFIHRHTGEVDSGRSEQLHIYTPEEISALLTDTGFEGPACFEGWGDGAYAGGNSMVVTARRPA